MRIFKWNFLTWGLRRSAPYLNMIFIKEKWLFNENDKVLWHTKTMNIAWWATHSCGNSGYFKCVVSKIATKLISNWNITMNNNIILILHIDPFFNNYGTSFQFMPQYFLTTVIQIFLFFWFEFYNWVIISLGFAACRTNIPQRSVFFYLWMRREIRHRSMLIYVKLKIQTQSISRNYFYFIHSSLFINWNNL